MVGMDGELSPYMQACMSNQPKHLRKNSTIMLNPHRSCTFKRYLFHFIYFLKLLRAIMEAELEGPQFEKLAA
jgi:hypothetical protein